MFKKITMFVAVAVIGGMFIPAVAFAAEKPKSTWQIYVPGLNQLTVLVGDMYSTIFFQGKVEDYDGKATSPITPTYKYKEKKRDLSKADMLESQGKEDKAQELRDKWAY